MTRENKTISERLILVEKITEDTNNIVKKLEDAIYGDGKPGLMTELRLLTQSVEKHHKNEEEMAKNRRGDYKWLIATLVAIASVLTAILAMFVK